MASIIRLMIQIASDLWNIRNFMNPEASFILVRNVIHYNRKSVNEMSIKDERCRYL